MQSKLRMCLSVDSQCLSSPIFTSTLHFNPLFCIKIICHHFCQDSKQKSIRYTHFRGNNNTYIVADSFVLGCHYYSCVVCSYLFMFLRLIFFSPISEIYFSNSSPNPNCFNAWDKRKFIQWYFLARASR